MKLKKSLLAGCVAIVTIAGMASCKGRTTKDVVPTGDTVEVIINPEETASDSTATIPA